jgi:hypothetical protein
VTIRLSIDRFEGDKKQIAVLLAEDSTAINFHRALLPKRAKAGDVSGKEVRLPSPPPLRTVPAVG